MTEEQEKVALEAARQIFAQGRGTIAYVHKPMRPISLTYGRGEIARVPVSNNKIRFEIMEGRIGHEWSDPDAVPCLGILMEGVLIWDEIRGFIPQAERAEQERKKV